MFDKDYYTNIWGDIHRHDYCESLAIQLIAKYGKCKILDIGTGCGFLVKTLREKGCDAWGLEISDYAIENSCDPEFVRKGDIRDIPYASGFDVVHSQGVWGYFPEEDIEKAWQECKRVGKHQEHNIDTSDNPMGEHDQYILWKPREWWKNKFHPKVLVACPNHVVKEYSFQRWIDNVKSLTYPNYDILVIDNSPNDSDFIDRWKDKVPMIHIDTEGIEELMVLRLNLSYEEIRLHFLAGDYERLMIIESDIITPIDVIEKMLQWGKDTDWISHGYPARGFVVDQEQGIGCSMFTRRLMEEFNFRDFADNVSSDGGLWDKVRPDRRFHTMELWSFWENKHLSEWQ